MASVIYRTRFTPRRSRAVIGGAFVKSLTAAFGGWNNRNGGQSLGTQEAAVPAGPGPLRRYRELPPGRTGNTMSTDLTPLLPRWSVTLPAFPLPIRRAPFSRERIPGQHVTIMQPAPGTPTPAGWTPTSAGRPSIGRRVGAGQARTTINPKAQPTWKVQGQPKPPSMGNQAMM